jgi:hypothetical protein
MDRLKTLSRRYFLGQCGLGAAALGSLLNEAHAGRSDPMAPKKPTRPAKAKAVIWLHMAGAPSQLDLWDYKPKLQQLTGKPCPKEFLEGKRFAFIRGVPNMMGTSYKFQRHGKSGAELGPTFSVGNGRGGGCHARRLGEPVRKLSR